MANDDRIGRLEAGLLGTLNELQDALIRIALLESELLAFRAISGSLAAEIVRHEQDPQQAMAAFAAKLLASAQLIAETDREQRGEASIPCVRYTQVIEAVITNAEEALVRGTSRLRTLRRR